MKITKLFITALMVVVTLSAAPLTANAGKVPMPSDSLTDARIYSHLLSRVTEIQSIDKTNLSAAEKKELKKELLQLKRDGEGLNKRVYLSVGAIIIIILLLILIL
jgi:hypothetical protein